MHVRYLWTIGALIGLITLPAQAQQATLFLCAGPDIVGRPSVDQIGGVDVSGCSNIIGLSSGLEVIVGTGALRGRPTCNQVEVLKALDPASPSYLTLAFQGTRVQRVDILFFAPNSDSGVIEQIFELSLRQSFITGVFQEVAEGQAVERVTFAPTRIIATFPETGGVANFTCDGRA